MGLRALGCVDNVIFGHYQSHICDADVPVEPLCLVTTSHAAFCSTMPGEAKTE